MVNVVYDYFENCFRGHLFTSIRDPDGIFLNCSCILLWRRFIILVQRGREFNTF